MRHGGVHAHYPRGRAFASRARIFSCMALQPRVGLLPKWRSRIGGGDLGDIAVSGQDLEAE